MSEMYDMRRLLDKAARLGFDEAQCRAVLPEWWDDDLASRHGGYVESALILAKGLMVSVKLFLRETEDAKP